MKLNSSTIVQLVIGFSIIGIGSIFYFKNSFTSEKKIDSIKKEFNQKVRQYEADQIANKIIIDKYTKEILLKKGWDENKIRHCELGASNQYSLSTQVDYENAKELAIKQIIKEYSK